MCGITVAFDKFIHTICPPPHSWKGNHWANEQLCPRNTWTETYVEPSIIVMTLWHDSYPQPLNLNLTKSCFSKQRQTKMSTQLQNVHTPMSQISNWTSQYKHTHYKVFLNTHWKNLLIDNTSHNLSLSDHCTCQFNVTHLFNIC